MQQHILEKNHNYEWGQEYILNTRVPTYAKEDLKYAIDSIEPLLQKIHLFQGYTASFICDLPPDILGVYINGTSSWPYIGLSYKNIQKGLKICDLFFTDALSTTIVHELGHAIQESLGLDFSSEKAEHQAEELAKSWYFAGEISDFFQQKLF